MAQTALNKLLDLSGKTAIVTGGAVGIGLGIVNRLAEAGANVVIANIDKAKGESATEQLFQKGFKVKLFKADVSKEEDVKQMVEFAVKTFGGVDVLVNNAGIYPNIPLEKMTAADFDKVIAVNLRGVFLCVKACADQMIKQGRGGKIINVTSIDALHPSAVGLAHYDASKHGAWGFTKNAALEYSQHKIWINAIAPGYIKTPGTEIFQTQMKAAGMDPKPMMDGITAKIPMKRAGEPDDIGKVALFLASDMSSYMTGEQIVVDGGILLA